MMNHPFHTSANELIDDDAFHDASDVSGILSGGPSSMAEEEDSDEASDDRPINEDVKPRQHYTSILHQENASSSGQSSDSDNDNMGALLRRHATLGVVPRPHERRHQQEQPSPPQSVRPSTPPVSLRPVGPVTTATTTNPTSLLNTASYDEVTVSSQGEVASYYAEVTVDEEEDVDSQDNGDPSEPPTFYDITTDKKEAETISTLTSDPGKAQDDHSKDEICPKEVVCVKDSLSADKGADDVLVKDKTPSISKPSNQVISNTEEDIFGLFATKEAFHSQDKQEKVASESSGQVASKVQPQVQQQEAVSNAEHYAICEESNIIAVDVNVVEDVKEITSESTEEKKQEDDVDLTPDDVTASGPTEQIDDNFVNKEDVRQPSKSTNLNILPDSSGIVAHTSNTAERSSKKRVRDEDDYKNMVHSSPDGRTETDVIYDSNVDQGDISLLSMGMLSQEGTKSSASTAIVPSHRSNTSFNSYYMDAEIRAALEENSKFLQASHPKMTSRSLFFRWPTQGGNKLARLSGAGMIDASREASSNAMQLSNELSLYIDEFSKERGLVSSRRGTNPGLWARSFVSNDGMAASSGDGTTGSLFRDEMLSSETTDEQNNSTSDGEHRLSETTEGYSSANKLKSCLEAFGYYLDQQNAANTAAQNDYESKIEIVGLAPAAEESGIFISVPWTYDPEADGDIIIRREDLSRIPDSVLEDFIDKQGNIRSKLITSLPVHDDSCIESRSESVYTDPEDEDHVVVPVAPAKEDVNRLGTSLVLPYGDDEPPDNNDNSLIAESLGMRGVEDELSRSERSEEQVRKSVTWNEFAHVQSDDPHLSGPLKLRDVLEEEDEAIPNRQRLRKRVVKKWNHMARIVHDAPFWTRMVIYSSIFLLFISFGIMLTVATAKKETETDPFAPFLPMTVSPTPAPTDIVLIPPKDVIVHDDPAGGGVLEGIRTPEPVLSDERDSTTPPPPPSTVEDNKEEDPTGADAPVEPPIHLWGGKKL